MNTGTIRFYKADKGYGFIALDMSTGKDMFFHIKGWKEVYEPNTGDRVNFDVMETDRGLQATNIQYAEPN